MQSVVANKCDTGIKRKPIIESSLHLPRAEGTRVELTFSLRTKRPRVLTQKQPTITETAKDHTYDILNVSTLSANQQ